jgi:hypothetical protein
MSERGLMVKLDSDRNKVVKTLNSIQHRQILEGDNTFFSIKDLTVYHCYTLTRNLEEVKKVIMEISNE